MADFFKELSVLLKSVPYYEISGRNERIHSLACDTSAAAEGCLFFCLDGLNTDGHDFAGEAVGRGAAALIVERFLPLDVTQVLVPDARRAMALIAGEFYGHPARRLKLVGVTGTNGKTTTTYILREIGKAAGYKTGLIGTTGNMIGERELPGKLTTPDPIELHRLLKEMLDAGVEWVVTEVSAHALDLKKVEGICFDVAVFTNLSQDHLDYFGTIERYKEVKKSFFTAEHCRNAVIYIDDAAGREIAASCGVRFVTYGVENPSDVFAIDFETSARGLKYVINLFDDIYDIRFNLSGRYNMYNTLAAAAAARLLGVHIRDIVRGIEHIKYIPGRFNILQSRPFGVIVDFAHTPEGIGNIAKCVREFCEGRLITVFGCGGNRDKSKRAPMGLAAGTYSDFVVVTSDNPRFEEPSIIIGQAEAGVKESGCGYICLENRQDAIAFALNAAKPDDIVLILGKGDENYQDIKGVKHPYNDADTVYAVLSGASGAGGGQP